ncbi:hypothetical protein L6452_04098 [Arctium lappa]|uniref:Uncharacterized protein n=1 Tax=Arctium lappa TaxID=4217 RepID=A0ACB9FNQ5_ARCLA|nr:hypothetical protein L6452_04098 [Arctium lappa]
MTSEVPCASGQWLKQESHSVLKDGLLAGTSSRNNISLRTGEEFSMEFLQDRGTVRQVNNGHSKVLSNEALLRNNGNHYPGYEELGVMLGLQRVDSVCSSDTAESTSARGSLSRPSAPSATDSAPSLVHRPSGSGVSDDSQRGKIKFICSSGGKILPRPSDGKLRYVGGETRIVSIQKNISWEELVKRTTEYCNQPHSIKYQLPGEDLDALISVSSNEDLQNMIEEYNGLGNLDGSQRLRIFLIPLSESESTCTIEVNGNQQHNPDYQYVVAVNGIVDHNPTRNNGCLTNEVRQLKSGTDQNLSFPQKQPPSFDPLQDNVGRNNSNVTPQIFEPLSSTKSPDNFPLISPDLVPQKDLMNGLVPAYKDPTCGSIEIPVLKGRTFHSENPIPQPADRMEVLLGSNDNGSHPGIPHAFSDPQLQELGGGSCFGSQDGNTLPPILSFDPPPTQAQLESVVLQEKPVEQHETAHPQAVIKIPSVRHPVSYSQTDSLQGSFGSESLKRHHCEANGINEKIQAAKQDLCKNAGVQNNSKENNPTFYEAENPCKNTSSATANGDIIKASNVNCNQIPVLVVGTPMHNLQGSDHIIPASVATNPNPLSDATLQQFSSNHLKKSSAESAINSRRIVENQHYAMTGIEKGEQGSNVTWVHNHEKSLTDLLYGLSDNVSHESAVQLPSMHQNGMSDQKPMLIGSRELHPSTGLDYAGKEPPSCVGPLMQNPTTGAGFRREVSLMDEDFFNYTKQEVGNLGYEEYYSKMQKEIPSIKDKEENKLELVDLLGDVTDATSCSHMLDAVSTEVHPSNEPTAESTFSDSNIEDAATDNGGKDGPFSNALIAEMEADMYGLQIIKNAELEELRELGSGTYGTVYHGRWRGSDVAIKRIKKSCFAGRSSEEERLTNDFWREARILSNLHHPNVVAFYGVVPDGAGGTLATVTEFMANGSLRNVLIKKDRSLDRRRKLILAMDAAFGMEYLHSKNIVHFDLKCDNLLVNMRDPQRPVCKVGDFGLSRIKRNTLVSGGVKGTLPWMAPELLNGSTTRVSEKVDVFSFGITMWEILTGEEPYANLHCGAIIGGIVKDTLRPVIPERCDPEWRKLMEQCWSADPIIRPSFTEITNRLQTMFKTLQANGARKGSHA